MFFSVTFTGPGAQLILTDEPVINVLRDLRTTAAQVFAPAGLRAAFSRTEPFLPLLAELAGTGPLGRLVLQLALGVIRRVLAAGTNRWS